MNENELKSLEVYNEKFKEDPTSFNDFQANDYIKLLKKSDNNEEAIEVGKTFMSLCPNLRGYLNQYGYALYNKFINIDDEKIRDNEDLFFSVPMHQCGKSRFIAMMYGQFSAIVEIPAALLGFIFATLVNGVLPFALCFAAGAMFFVCIEELIPEANATEGIDLGTISFMIGFVIMMSLDILLS